MLKFLKKNSYISIGLMLFALFFGAGNLIFPAFLGQNAGSNLPVAMTGFIIMGVGLPLLGVVVMGLEKITFGWYMKHVTWIAAAGYFAGILSYWVMRNCILTTPL